MANLFESKLDAQNHVIRLKESNFEWLQEEYSKFKAGNKPEHQAESFAKFADIYLNELSNKIKVAKEILTMPNFTSLNSQNTEKN